MTIGELVLQDGWECYDLALPMTIAPGEQKKFSVGRAPVTAHGERRSALTESDNVHLVVRSDDPVRPYTYATLRVRSTPDIEVYESAVDFGDGPLEDVVERRRQVLVRYWEKAGDLYVEPSMPWLQAALLREVPGSLNPWNAMPTYAQVEFALDPAYPFEAGEHHAEVLIDFLGPEGDAKPSETAIRLPARVCIWPQLRARPPELFFGIAGPGVTVEKQVEVVGDKAGPLHLDPACQLPTGIEVEVRQYESSGSTQLHATARGPALPAGVTQGSIVLLAGKAGSQQRKLVIPYYVLAMGREAERPWALQGGASLKSIHKEDGAQ